MYQFSCPQQRASLHMFSPGPRRVRGKRYGNPKPNFRNVAVRLGETLLVS